MHKGTTAQQTNWWPRAQASGSSWVLGSFRLQPAPHSPRRRWPKQPSPLYFRWLSPLRLAALSTPPRCSLHSAWLLSPLRLAALSTPPGCSLCFLHPAGRPRRFLATPSFTLLSAVHFPLGTLSSVDQPLRRWPLRWLFRATSTQQPLQQNLIAANTAAGPRLCYPPVLQQLLLLLLLPLPVRWPLSLTWR